MADTINDLMYRFYSALVTGTSSLSGAINVSRAAVGVEATTSVTGAGSATSPGAAATIAQIAALPAGTWEIMVDTFILGTTVGALESDNLRFSVGGAPVATIIVPVNGATGGVNNSKFTFRLNQLAPATIAVVTNAAGTVGSIYKSSIIANKIGF
jgi:hypothetical protein